MKKGKMGSFAPGKTTKPKSAPKTKPHVNMRKIKMSGASAFPTAPMAFPPSGAPAAPDAAMGAAPGGMSGGAAQGDMGE